MTSGGRMKRVGLAIAMAGLVGCSARGGPEPEGPAPGPESVAEATGEIRGVTLPPETELSPGERAALQVERIEMALKPEFIHEGDTARLEVSFRDAGLAPVSGVSAQIFVVEDTTSSSEQFSVPQWAINGVLILILIGALVLGALIFRGRSG